MSRKMLAAPPVDAPSTDAQSQRAPSFLPMVVCGSVGIVYILSLLLSVAVIFNVAGFVTNSRLSLKLAWFGKWLPHDLGLAKEAYVSRQDTGFLELLALLALTFAAYGLCALYSSKLLRAPEMQRRLPQVLRLIWLGTLLGGVIYLFTPGLLASDIYSYASYGRLLVAHAANPYFVPPSAFPQDPIYHLLYWKNTVSIYGPIWMGVCALLALVGGTSQEGVILAFRVFAFAAHLLNIWLITATLRTMGRSARTVALGTLLYAWNPLVLAESALGGHNDVFMVTFLLLGLFFCARAEGKRPAHRWAFIPPLIAFSLAALVKFSAVPVIAIFILALFCRTLQATGNRGRDNHNDTGVHRIRSAILTSLIACCISAGLALALYAPFWIGHSLKEIVTSFISLPSAVNAFNSILFTLNAWKGIHGFPGALAFLTDRKLWNIVNVVAMVLPVAIGIRYLWRAPTTRTVALVSLAALAIFLVLTPWFFAWYVTWLVALAALCLPATGRLARALLAFTLALSATAFLTYYSTLIGWYLLGRPFHDANWAVLVCMGALGVPLLTSLGACFLRRKSNIIGS